MSVDMDALARALCRAEGMCVGFCHHSKSCKAALQTHGDYAQRLSPYIARLLAEQREADARVAEEVGRGFLSTEYATPQPIGSIQERFACGQVAAAIRASAEEANHA